MHFMENWLIFLGIWGEADLSLRIWKQRKKYFQAAEEVSFRDLARSMHFFSGIKGAQTPPPPHEGASRLATT